MVVILTPIVLMVVGIPGNIYLLTFGVWLPPRSASAALLTQTAAGDG